MASNAGRVHYDVVVIGSGFGGTMVALSLARKLKGTGKKILMLERGTWWTTPVGTVQDKEVKTADFLKKQKEQPVQFWPSMDHFKGLLDILIRCARYEGNEDGLYDFTTFGKRGFLGIGDENDGVMILRASGVGGGSLVYSNITIQPPDVVFEDPRWPGWTRDAATRSGYYELARKAIGFGVVFARESQENPQPDPKLKAYSGLHNIATRSARLDPHFEEATDSGTGRKFPRLSVAHPQSDPKNALWIDRARVFQSAAAEIGAEYGNVDSSISDLPLGTDAYDPGAKPLNYCERQGRCNVGCLPGARFTLNKQLMAAIHGTPDGAPPLFPELSLWALTEVDSIEAEGGRYVIHYRKRDAVDPKKTEAGTIEADRLILSAGCVGTTEILLRSRQGLPGLSPRLGEGFSTNGDYIAFLDETDEHVSLTRGPVTTSFAHFNNTKNASGGRFHTLEDQGIPKALASVTGYGVPFIRALTKGVHPRADHILSLLRLIEGRLVSEVSAYFKNAHERRPEFTSEDEKVAKMMCVVGMGLDAANGTFTLGEEGETALRLKRTDGKAFHEDPVYVDMRKSLEKLARVLRRKGDRDFVNPFLSPTADALDADAIVLSHPLGGCRMAATVDSGVVDESGRVFDASKPAGSFYPGLFIADASVIPTALGVNPSLTIAALSLHIADTIIEEMKPGA